jgi:hypothetical protein
MAIKGKFISLCLQNPCGLRKILSNPQLTWTALTAYWFQCHIVRYHTRRDWTLDWHLFTSHNKDRSLLYVELKHTHTHTSMYPYSYLRSIKPNETRHYNFPESQPIQHTKEHKNQAMARIASKQEFFLFSLQRDTSVWIPWFQSSTLQPNYRNHFCCFNQLVCGPLL